MNETVFPPKRKMTCKTKEQAEELQKEFESFGVVNYSSVFQRERRHAGKWGVLVELRCFIPRCQNVKCPGRSIARFHFPEDAITSWNRRI